MMEGKISAQEVWLWRVLPILSVFSARVYSHWAGKYLNRMWFNDVLLVIGWILGWLLAEADHFFYALVSNPQELSSQKIIQEIKNKDWKKIWQVIRDTKSDRVKLPIRNILTAFVMTGVGLWVVTSGSSLVAAGLCLGFSVRLFSEALTDPDFKNWYWLFTREFTLTEHHGVMMGWGIILIWQWWMLIRG
jgi:hypothetical protein